jgi:hypothetical protein
MQRDLSHEACRALEAILVPLRGGSMQDAASERLRIPLLRTRVNSALEELEDGLVDRGVPFDS